MTNQQDQFNLLRKIDKNPEFSQRKLAKQIGVSLGKVFFDTYNDDIIHSNTTMVFQQKNVTTIMSMSIYLMLFCISFQIYTITHRFMNSTTLKKTHVNTNHVEVI